MPTNAFSPPEDPALGAAHPLELTETRLELHWGIQVAGAAGLTFVEAQPDYSHTSLAWDNRLRALVGRPFGPSGSLRAGLRLDELSILLIDRDEHSVLDLGGKTLDEAYGWLAGMISGALDPNVAHALTRFDHEMPHHAVADGTPFSDVRTEHREFAGWYEKAHWILSQISDRYPTASPVRCWPHHFDIATMIEVDRPEKDEGARSIGIGMSPGDAGYDQPYWYVTPWPYPARELLEPLPEGSWHTEGWTGAVLTGSRIVESASARSQTALIRRFLEDAITASTTALRIPG